MKKIFLFGSLIALSAFAVANAGQNSQYDSCDKQYTSDIAECNKVASSANRAKCFSSASDRLAKCNNSKGTILNVPTLFKG